MVKTSSINWLALSFISGLIIAEIYSSNALLAQVLLVTIAVIISLIAILLKKPLFLLAISLFMLTGFAVMTIENHSLDTSMLSEVSKEEKILEVEATLIEDGRIIKGNTRAYAVVEEVRVDKESWSIKEKTYNYINDFNRNLFSGDRLIFTSRPRSINSEDLKNQGYTRSMERRGVAATFNVESSEIDKIIPGGGGVDAVRKRVSDSIKKSVGKPYSGILLGILIGDTDGISDTDMRIYERVGLLHLFAVSGLNVTLNIAFIFLICRLLNLRPGAILVISLVSLAFFVWLVGGGASVNRAALMSSVVLASWYLGRRGDILAALSISALIILVIGPKEIFSVSFQLSFGALLGILLITPVLTNLFDSEIRGLVLPATVALGAQLAVHPFIAYYFNQLSIVSLISNMVIVPPVAAITSVGFIATLVSLVDLTVAGILYKTLLPLLWYVVNLSKLLASIPGASTRVASPGFIYLVIYAAALGISLYYISKFPKKLGFASFVIMILSIVTIGIWTQIPLSMSNDLRVTFIDVGQGDSTLIQSPRGKTILIDGGPDFKSLDKILIDKNIKKIDILIISHSHLDHIKGLIEVIKEYPVGTVMDSTYKDSSPYHKELIDSAVSKGVEYVMVSEGDSFEVDEIEFDILSPEDEYDAGEDFDANNESLVVMVTYKEFDLLFPGDIELDSISELLKDYPKEIDAEVLKVSHHGSRNGTTEEFLEAVMPIEAIISVGQENSFGHPHLSTLDLMRTSGVRLWRTDEDSSVEIVSDGKRYEIWPTAY